MHQNWKVSHRIKSSNAMKLHGGLEATAQQVKEGERTCRTLLLKKVQNGASSRVSEPSLLQLWPQPLIRSGAQNHEMHAKRTTSSFEYSVRMYLDFSPRPAARRLLKRASGLRATLSTVFVELACLVQPCQPASSASPKQSRRRFLPQLSDAQTQADKLASLTLADASQFLR